MSIKDLYKNGMFLEITIPKKIINNLNKEEFNSYFTDILLDAKISDNLIKIQVTLDHYFEAKVR